MVTKTLQMFHVQLNYAHALQRNKKKLSLNKELKIKYRNRFTSLLRSMFNSG
jgi:hypothetical protein